jgi:pyruvate/2-oxoglutarate dehydrogenase complex dihydrolipoamide acyltransferase (E2) component
VAILGLGRVRRSGDRRILAATLVFDHRALDGADGARFLADLARTLETPTALLS